MKAQMNIQELTDRESYRESYRELRIYRRRIRRQREIRRRCMMLIMTVCLIMVGTVSYHSIKLSANTGENLYFKYYTNITVSYGETLWEIADEYIDYNQYEDKNAYIDEVININHLNADASIKAGQHLVVPYFSSEFVK